MKKSLIFIFTLILVFSLCHQVNADETVLVSSFFYNTDIRDALNEVSLSTGINIIYDQTVQGFVTLDLDSVPIEKALDMILFSGGFIYQKYDDFYFISLPDRRSPNFKRLVESETYSLKYTTANEIVSLLPHYYKDFVQTSTVRNNLISITAPAVTIEEIKEYIKMIDKPVKEILIQVLVTEISTELIKERGGDLFRFLDMSPDDNYFSLNYDRTGISTEVARGFGELESRLRFLTQTEDVTIRANPRIQVIDRETATLFIGEEQVIILEPANAPARLERVDVGVAISVTPQIVDDSILRLKINPDISHFSEERQERLVVKRSELNTAVFAEDGETLTLAGMTLSRETEFTSAVPILGDIPVLRWLFRQETERASERELFIFLTPEIVRK